MKPIIREFWMVVALLCASLSAFAHDFEIDGVRYTITSFTDLTVTAESLSNDAAESLTLPVFVKFREKNLKVSNIGPNFAYGNNKLTQIKIESSLGVIGNGAFAHCQKLENVIISSCISIGDTVFMNSSRLESISLPENLIHIASGAFAYCKSLKQIQLPSSLEELGNSAFLDCSSLVKCNISQLSTIPEGAFSGCTSITDISIPSSIEKIGDHAFLGCTNLNGIKLPNSLISIGKEAFKGCKSLSEFYIPDSVDRIGENALLNCENIKTISIGSGITKLNGSSLWGCSKLENLILRESDKELEIGTDGAECYKRPVSTEKYNDYYYYGSYKNLRLTSLVVKRPITHIYKRTYPNYQRGENAHLYCSPFENNPYIQQVICSGYFQLKGDLWHKYTHLSGSSYSSSYIQECTRFLQCVNIQRVSLGIGVKEIPENCFNGAHSLESITMTGVQYIRENAFLDCTALREIELPNTIKSISNSISSCALTTILIRKFQPPTADGFPNDIYINCRLIVPASCLDVYQKSSPWLNFWNIEEYDIPISGIILNETGITLNEGQSATLTAAVIPDIAKNKILIWESSNTSVATVNQDGKVTAVAKGSAIITAKSTDGSNISASCNVNVVKLVSGIVLSETEMTLNEGSTAKLTAIVSSGANNPTLIWTSNNETVATVSQDGRVTAIAKGSAIITAKATDGSGITASCKVNVIKLVNGIVLSETEMTLEEGQTATLSAAVIPDVANNKTIAWSSSDESIASVDGNGLITAHLQGRAIITATSTDGSNISASCTVTVVKMVSSIYISNSTITMNRGEQTTIRAYALPTDATNPYLLWYTENENVATVEDGIVTAIGAGTTIIKVESTDGSKIVETCEVEVKDPAGIESTYSSEPVKVYVLNGIINIANVPASQKAHIFLTNGSLVKSEISNGNLITFKPSANGIYIVVVGSQSYKIVIR